MNLGVALGVSYLVGAIPASYLIARFAGGVDLRNVGSGNLGATNLFRALGWKFAVPAGLFDIGKGFAPVFFLSPWVGDDFWIPLSLGAAAIVGHVFPIYLKFKGGKGVATALGAVIAIAPIPSAIAVGIWVVILKTTGFMSMASMLGATAFPIAVWFFQKGNPPLLWAGIAIAGFIVFTHRENIRRLLSGTESRFGRGRKVT
ncbi:MAG: glycerol-3-phosphate 1-O-acyltransferase PlsY [Gemmatimonadota bacterium]|nr:glycerol-3-phosphate 1-O-acyltransferase PlsY [Gemmatimonadota bacterium]